MQEYYYTVNFILFDELVCNISKTNCGLEISRKKTSRYELIFVNTLRLVCGGPSLFSWIVWF